MEKGIIMMPNSIFFDEDSPTKTDKYVRLALCKDRQSTETVIERLRHALD